METNKSASLPSNKLRVLIIDDEKNIRATLSLCLEQMGCAVTAVSAPEAALAALRQQPYDLAFLDLRLGESNGLDIIPKLLTVDAGLQVIVITAYATIDTAVDAIKRGAADYLPKPFTPQQIRHVVDQNMKQRDLKTRLSDLEGRFKKPRPPSTWKPTHQKFALSSRSRPRLRARMSRYCYAAKAVRERVCWRA